MSSLPRTLLHSIFLGPTMHASIRPRLVPLAWRAPHPFSHQLRSLVTLRDQVTVTHATAEGPGRSGHVYSVGHEEPLDLKMHPPKSMGGKRDGHNPEQLFAMAFSSCFLESLQRTARQAGMGAAANDAKVHASVYLGHQEASPGLGLKVHLAVEGIDDDSIIVNAHRNNMYSQAINEGIEIKLQKV